MGPRASQRAFSTVVLYRPRDLPHRAAVKRIRRPLPLSEISAAPAIHAPARVFSAAPPHLVIAPRQAVAEAPLLVPARIDPQIQARPLQIAPPAPVVQPKVQVGTFEAPRVVTPNTADRRGVAVAGFDSENQVAGGTGKRSLVRPAGFGDAVIASPAAPTRRVAPPDTGPWRPVEILQKPAPAYTAEARRLNIEGEVVLEAVFMASGHLRVLRTVKSLGHGLDEMAFRAAEAIRYRPAERNGRAVDVTAAVHILFQLAN